MTVKIKPMPPCGECVGCAEITQMKSAMAEITEYIQPRLDAIRLEYEQAYSDQERISIRRYRKMLLISYHESLGDILKSFHYPICVRIGFVIENPEEQTE